MILHYRQQVSFLPTNVYVYHIYIYIYIYIYIHILCYFCFFISSGSAKLSSGYLWLIVVRFKGPAAQKSFMISHGSDVIPDKYEDNKYGAHEVIRSIFALTNTNTAPPVTTDSELIWLFNKVDDEHINAKLRIASYLNAQSDKLYFEAKNQAVSIADYNLVLRRIT